MDYVDYGFTDDAPPYGSDVVFPVVLALAGELPAGTRVLDAGCGNGALAGHLLERGWDVVGIDLGRRGIEIARAAYPAARFEVMPVDDQMVERLDEASFDLVVSTEVVEHLYAPGPFLRGCFAALRPGGRLILSTPYHGWLKNVLIAVTGRFDRHVAARHQGGHIKFWSKRTLSEALRDAGFDHLEFRGAGGAPFLWRSLVVAARRPDQAS
jgi:2-polyprenyl-3-methyl-5-hydroxy-6-metoxy-1,4-benzoquinol methylase